MITRLAVEEFLGVSAELALVFAGLWFGFPGPAFRSLMRRIARNRRDEA